MGTTTREEIMIMTEISNMLLDDSSAYFNGSTKFEQELLAYFGEHGIDITQLDPGERASLTALAFTQLLNQTVSEGSNPSLQAALSDIYQVYTQHAGEALVANSAALEAAGAIGQMLLKAGLSPESNGAGSVDISAETVMEFVAEYGETLSISSYRNTSLNAIVNIAGGLDDIGSINAAYDPRTGVFSAPNTKAPGVRER